MTKRHRGRPARMAPGLAPGSPKPRLPHFDLAPLEGIDPTAVDTQTPIAKLMLVLAVAFNDLKGLMLFGHLLGPPDTLKDGTVASTGQRVAMMGQVARFIAGVLHELVEEMREQRSTIESPEFSAIVASLKQEPREAWGMMPISGRQVWMMICTRCGWKQLDPVAVPTSRATRVGFRKKWHFDFQDCDDVARAIRDRVPGAPRRDS